jgi:hypothetical protein
MTAQGSHGRVGMTDRERKLAAIDWCKKTISHARRGIAACEKDIEEARKDLTRLNNELRALDAADEARDAMQECKVIAIVRELGT